MLVVPSVAHEHYARALAPIIDGSQPIFINPGHTGGGLHFLHELRSAGYRGPVRSCETVTLTYITRMEGPALVNIYSYTKRLRFAALPGKQAADLFALIKPLYPEIRQASSVLETALGESQRGIPSRRHDHECRLDPAYRRRLSVLSRRLHRRGRTRDRGGGRRAHGGCKGVGHSGEAIHRHLLRGRADDQGGTGTAATSRGRAGKASRTRPSNLRPRSITATSTRTSAMAWCRWRRSAGLPASRRRPSMRWCSLRGSRSGSTMRVRASRSERLGLAGKSPSELLQVRRGRRLSKER